MKFTTTLGGAALLVTIAGGSVYAGIQAPNEGRPKSGAQVRASELATQSARAEMTGDHSQALQLADEACKAEPTEPWAYYYRGDALASMGRIDDAVAAFQDAEKRFPDSDVWGKSVAAWGQANAFKQVGRCPEAVLQFEHYVALIQTVDKDSVVMARQAEKQCTPRAPGR
jgi:tetratricopeptide (TPR) repeat protein